MSRALNLHLSGSDLQAALALALKHTVSKLKVLLLVVLRGGLTCLCMTFVTLILRLPFNFY